MAYVAGRRELKLQELARQYPNGALCPIRCLDLPSGLKMTLMHRFVTLGEMAKLTAHDILQIDGVAMKTLEQLEEILAFFGLGFRE